MSVSFLPEIKAIQFAFLNYVGVGASLNNVRDYIKSLRPMTDQAFYAMSSKLETMGLIEKEGNTGGCTVALTDRGEQVCDDYEDHSREVLSK